MVASDSRLLFGDLADTNGKIVDATYETLVQKKVFRERLSDLISKLQATASGKG